MALTNNFFEYGVNKWVSGNIAGGNMEYASIPFFLPLAQAGAYPPIVTGDQPISGNRAPASNPIFIASIAPDPNGYAMSFLLEVCADSSFNTIGYSSNTLTDYAHWSYSIDDGATWLAFPNTGKITPTATWMIKHTSNMSGTVGHTYSWRCNANNGQYSSPTFNVNAMLVGDTMYIQTKPVDTGSTAAVNIVPNVSMKLPTNGNTPADYQVFACNNANDASPTWEDCTTVAKATSTTYTFTNAVKTALTFAIAIKIVVHANDGSGEIACYGFGFNYN